MNIQIKTVGRDASGEVIYVTEKFFLVDDQIAAPIVGGDVVSLPDEMAKELLTRRPYTLEMTTAPANRSDIVFEDVEIMGPMAEAVVSKIDEVVAAIRSMDPAETELWTQAGKPKTEAIEDLTDFPVTAAMRDKALEIVQG